MKIKIENKDRFPWVEWLDSPRLAGSVGYENLFLLGYDPEELGAPVMARSHADQPTELSPVYLHELAKFSQDKIEITIEL
jgi:hypothetical protein